jgi:probable phosphoglycerate mutase
MRLYLVRHAQTAWNALNRAQGHADEPLDEVGIEQARAVATAFIGTEVSRVLTSDLARARRTAEFIAEATQAELTLDRRLRETFLGNWEGREFPEILADRRALASNDDPYALSVRPPRGESTRDVWERIAGAASEIDASLEQTVIVVHGGAGALLLARLVRANLETGTSFRFGNASITELERRQDGRWAFVRLNDTSHLNGAPILSGSLDGSTR